MLILIYNVMKKIMILVGALFVSVASHAIWFHTSCGYSEYQDASLFANTDAVIAYMAQLGAEHCTDMDDHLGEFPEENPGEN